MKRLFWVVSLLSCFVGNAFADAGEVHVYSARIEKLIKPAFDAFTKETGIQVKYLTAKDAQLIERLKAEGKHTEADVLITVDAGNLWHATENDLLQSVDSQTLEKNIPEHLRDPDSRWFGLTVRARTIVYHKDRVSPKELSTYEALGDSQWKGRLCLRTSKKVYNRSLIGSMVETQGEGAVKTMLDRWMENDPRIEAKDSAVLKAIAAGKCDVGVVNTYYLGRMLKKDPNFPVALFWANQEGRGVHVNISGAGVTKHAKNRKAAVQLIEFLSSEKAQNLFADNNMEYPANPKSQPSSLLSQWWGAAFKTDTVTISSAGKNQATAVRLMEVAGYQ